MMGIVIFLLYTVEVVVCLLLMAAVLIQRTKSQGMGLAIGAGMGEAMFGSQAGNVLTRATVILAGIFLCNTTILAMIGTQRVERSVTERAPVEAVVPEVPVNSPAPVPVSGGVPGAAPDFAPLAAGPVDQPASAAGGVPSAPVPISIPAAPVEGVPAAVPAAPAAEPAPVN